MQRFAFLFGVVFPAVLFFQLSTAAQVKCDGTQLFTEKQCLGDEVDEQEKELLRIINTYRLQNKLPPIVLSEPLSIVANRRLLDLNLNMKSLTHSWSNCQYDIKNEITWGCVLNAPKTLGVNYEGNGYENLYRNHNAQATPVLALEAWKKSDLHNSLILNLSIFKDLKWDGIGLAISGNYAAIWVGAKSGATVKPMQSQGLGVTFEKAMEGMKGLVTVEKLSSLGEKEKWGGISQDKTISMEIFGRHDDIAEAAVGLSIKIDKSESLTERNRTVLLTFLKNLVPNWSQGESWADAAVKNLLKDRRIVQSAPIGNRFVEMNLSASNILTVRIKPNNKSAVLQF